MTTFFSYGGKNKVYTSPSQSTPNETISIEQLIAKIKSDPPVALLKVREITKQSFDAGVSSKYIKNEIKPFKNSLDWCLLSGTCPKHHNNETLQYNGVIQIDIDFKFAHGDTKAHETKERLKAFDFVMFAAISPSGFGVKAAIQTDNFNKEHHKKVCDAVMLKLSKELEIDLKYFDSLGASQPCFIPYDTDVYYTSNFATFDTLSAVVEFERNKAEHTIATVQRNAPKRHTPLQISNVLKRDDDILEYLTTQIEKQRIDLTNTFQKWCAIAFSVASIGNRGLQYFHRIARMNETYDEHENDKLFADALRTGKAHTNIGHLINECKAANIDLQPIFETSEPKQQIDKLVNISLKEHEYLSTKISVSDFTTGLHVVTAGTGTGKSFFVANSFENVVIVSRNVTTLENYEQYGFAQFLKRDEKNGFADISAGEHRKITVTYKSFKYLLKTIDASKFVFVFDESHLLNESFSKVESETRFCYNSLKGLSETNIVILLSANVLYLNDDVTIRKQYNVTKHGIEKKVEVYYNSNLPRLLHSIKAALADGKKVLVYTNRKEHGHTVSEYLKDNLHGNTIFFFDSSRHGQTDLQNLQYDVTITTSALVTGKDVNNENLCVIFYDLSKQISDLPSRSSLVQFLGRARKYKSAAYQIHFELKENTAFGTYSLFNLRNNALKIARLTCECSYDDISFFVENKHGFATRNEHGFAIDYFSIDKFLQRAVSRHTLLNSSRLKEYLKQHNYTADVEMLADAEPIETTADATDKKALFLRELDTIKQDTAHDFELVTNAPTRYHHLRKCGFSHENTVAILEKYVSKNDWLMFVNLLAVEIRLQQKDIDGFFDMYHDILTITPTHKKAKFIAKMLSHTRTVYSFELARIVKSTRTIDFSNKYHIRKLLNDLKQYYLIDTIRTMHERTYKLNASQFLKVCESVSAVDFERLSAMRFSAELMQ